MTDHDLPLMARANNGTPSGIVKATARAALEAETTTTLLAPHLFFPNEILAEIFLHCQNTEFGQTAPLWNLKSSPWVISRVCKLWRSVALATPGLWRDIRIGDKRLPRIVDMTKEIMLRSANRHISMRATRGGKYPAEFFDLIAANFGCFKSLCIKGSLSDLTPILSSPSGNAAQLQELHIECSGRIQHLSFLESASALRELRLFSLAFPASSLLRLSLSKITWLELMSDSLNSNEVFGLLNRCPAVEYCRIRVVGPSVLAHSRSLILSCLRGFVIYPDKSDSLGFFASLIMPCLTHLQVFAPFLWMMDFTRALSHSVRLGRLQLASAMSAADLDILLLAAPNIRHLEFHDVLLSTQALHGIIAGTLLPRTRTFDFVCIVQTLNALTLHLDMFENRFSRASYDIPCLRLALDHSYGETPEMDRLWNMKDEGWHIEVLVPT